MFRQTLPRSLALGAAFLGLGLYAGFGGAYAREIVTEIALLALLAVALDFVAGFGGMISLCHGAAYGLGAYAYAVATEMGGQGAPVGFLAALVAAALFGLAVGAVTANTTGIFFIMATLAFGQMAWAAIFQSPWLGGDDGMSASVRLDLSLIGIDLNTSLAFALFCLGVLALACALLAVVLRAAFGQTLVGLHANEARMRALGLTAWRHKAMAFGLSCGIAGIAGALAAQHTLFVSPELLTWTVSGEALVVVILGGLGTLAGPVIGAIAFVLLKKLLEGATEHWHLFVGLVLIATVLAGGRGLFGQAEHLLGRRRRSGA